MGLTSHIFHIWNTASLNCINVLIWICCVKRLSYFHCKINKHDPFLLNILFHGTISMKCMSQVLDLFKRYSSRFLCAFSLCHLFGVLHLMTGEGQFWRTCPSMAQLKQGWLLSQGDGSFCNGSLADGLLLTLFVVDGITPRPV